MREDISFHSEAGQPVPTLLFRREQGSGRSPAVIVLHGTGGDKERLSSRLRELANRGFIAVAIDGLPRRAFYDRVAPGIYGEFDGPAMLPLIAPRPLLVINGDSDPRTPVGGVRECLAGAERAYKSQVPLIV